VFHILFPLPNLTLPVGCPSRCLPTEMTFVAGGSGTSTVAQVICGMYEIHSERPIRTAVRTTNRLATMDTLFQPTPNRHACQMEWFEAQMAQEKQADVTGAGRMMAMFAWYVYHFIVEQYSLRAGTLRTSGLQPRSQSANSPSISLLFSPYSPSASSPPDPSSYLSSPPFPPSCSSKSSPNPSPCRATAPNATSSPAPLQ
jgi:hypothetical protein